MKILICGDRNWDDYNKIKTKFTEFNSCNDVIIVGGATGADSIAEDIAIIEGFEVIVKPADWIKYGRAAGPIRNKAMLDLKPDKVIAFHSDIENSKGTKNCVDQAKERGIQVEVIE
jgi:hypothetical protein